MARPSGPWSEKRFRQALQAAVSQKEKGQPRLRLIAEQLALAALGGDIQAIREVADRLDGKPRQELDAVISDERFVVNAPTPEETADDWAGETQAALMIRLKPKRTAAAIWAGLAEVAAQEAVTPITPGMGRKALWKATHCPACGQLLTAKLIKAAAKRKGNA